MMTRKYSGVWAVMIAGAVLLTASQVRGADAPKAEKKTTKQPAKKADVKSPWGDFVEKDFPFFSSVLDARKIGDGWPTNNLTPRGLILNLGNDCWACFDTDLLRVSAIWSGDHVTAVSMAAGSYHNAGDKAPEGQGKLPGINGTTWIANGLYPGWQTGTKVSLEDPRTPSSDVKELGRGPIDPKLGQFKAVRLVEDGVILEYTVLGVPVQERLQSRKDGENLSVARSFQFASVPQNLWLVLGQRPAADDRKLAVVMASSGKGVAELISQADGLQTVKVTPSSQPVMLQVALSLAATVRTGEMKFTAKPAPPRWPQTVTTKAIASTSSEAYVLDDIAIPDNNPWKRNVRFADLAFFADGRAAFVTFDGDVWIASGLNGDMNGVQWKRFASGLHEPMGIAIRQNEIFVHDRNGLWRLRDTDNNGEADVHELFCNLFAQTAETREFAAGLRAAPDGSFVISKGGQQGSTIGKLNGTVLRIAPDGKSFATLGWGFREPFIGVHPKTGLVTVSDQQGNYVPSTPLYIIKGNEYHGFLSNLLPKEKYPAPIADPLTWIPHPVNSSAVGQVWLSDAKMGGLSDALIHIGYNRPEIFLVRLNERSQRTQAAVVSLTKDFAYAPLNGAVNPLDGQLYLTGFQIWGTTAKRISGISRVRFTGAANPWPREIAPMDKGVLIRFDVPLEPQQATNLANYSLERWNYQRTANYGSPHFKLDGTKGTEQLAPSSVYLAKDGKSVFLGVPDMKRVMQMRVGWNIALKDGKKIASNAYFTPYEFPAFNPTVEGFDPITVDLTPRAMTIAENTPVTVEEGARLAELLGCVACHSNDGTTVGKVGPSWKGLYGGQVDIFGKGKVTADEAYLRESIKDPTAKIVKGFEKSDAGMPSYEGVISDAQIEALILYLKTLK